MSAPRFRFPFWPHRTARRHARKHIASPEMAQMVEFIAGQYRSRDIRTLYARGLRLDQIARLTGHPVSVVAAVLA